MKNFTHKLLFIGAFFLFGGIFFSQDIKSMEEKLEVLNLNANLMEKRIALEKEKEKNAVLTRTAELYNKKADNLDGKYESNDAKTNSKDAKRAAKILKDTENTNSSLLKSNSKILDIEKDIIKLEEKLGRLRYEIEFKGDKKEEE